MAASTEGKNNQTRQKRVFMSDVTDAFSSVFETGKKEETSPFLPKDELVGGSVPYIPGVEEETVWNAASQACATERVHFCYTIEGDKCWYLATPSSALASNPDSWCPLAAALPGNSEYWDKDTVYIYEEEGTASAIRWDNETGRMQVYLGASRILLPRLQSMDTNFVTINPKVATKVLWKNRYLNRERMSRLMVKTMFFLAVAVTSISFLMWIFTYFLTVFSEPEMTQAKKVSQEAANNLMIEAVNAYQNNTDHHLARIIELLNTTGGFGGILTKYEVNKDGGVEWTALIPNAVKPEQIKATAVGAEGDRIKIRGTK